MPALRQFCKCHLQKFSSSGKGICKCLHMTRMMYLPRPSSLCATNISFSVLHPKNGITRKGCKLVLIEVFEDDIIGFTDHDRFFAMMPTPESKRELSEYPP